MSKNGDYNTVFRFEVVIVVCLQVFVVEWALDVVLIFVLALSGAVASAVAHLNSYINSN